jgi:hypothetical protein
VLTSWGQGQVASLVGPLVIDGIMMAAGAALLADHHREAGGDLVKPPVTSDDEELRARARVALRVDPTIGRDRLADALNADRVNGNRITVNRARTILDELKEKAEAVPDGG